MACVAAVYSTVLLLVVVIWAAPAVTGDASSARLDMSCTACSQVFSSSWGVMVLQRQEGARVAYGRFMVACHTEVQACSTACAVSVLQVISVAQVHHTKKQTSKPFAYL